MSHKDTNSTRRTLITDLPEEVLLKLFSYLPHSDIYFTLRNVCSGWRKISESSSLWKSFVFGEEYSNVPVKENVEALVPLKNWLTEISPYLSGLNVDYAEQHEVFLDVVKDAAITFPKVQTLEVDYGELREEPTEEDIASLITTDDVAKMFPNMTEMCIRCFQILPEFILDKIHILHKLQKIRLIFRSCECGMHPGDTIEQNEYLQNFFKSYSNFVEVEGNSLSNDTVALVLKRFAMLERISFAGSTKIGFDAFKEMPLKEALLTLCIDESAIDESCLEIMLKNSPNLKYLSMKECSRINDIGLSYVGTYCKNLETLYIEDNVDVLREITDIGIDSVARGCIHLKVLEASWIEKITDNSLKFLSQHCSKLATIQMAGCDVTDLGIKVLSEGCRSLRCVDFSECQKLTDKSVEYLSKNCLFLNDVSFEKCKLISDAKVSDEFKNLQL